MYKIQGTTITMTRGDTLRADIQIKNRDRTIYTPTENDVIKFAVKQNYTDTEELITKYIQPDEMLLEIEPEDTETLPFGKYVYDIELTTEDGTVDTFISKAIINICEEVG